MRFTRVTFLALALVLPALSHARQRSHTITPKTKVNTKDLPAMYREWLEEDVVYLINEDEKREFLQLPTDLERDKFMEAFWAARNPDPNSSLINTYKEEHYRRLAYVRAHFGDPNHNDGWRTDMGHVYISLGPPKQKAVYHIGISTRPVEIWFYQSPSPALPPYFNLVFYKRGDSDPYTLYSPLQDGPNRIVTNDASGTTPASALKVIMGSMGAEATHAMVTLFPDEAANIQDPQPNMDSDFLLSNVRDLANLKLEKDRISHLKHANREQVTSSIFTGGNGSTLETAVLRDDQGRQTIHYLLKNRQLDGRLVGMLPDKKTGYSMSLQTRVMTSDGKAVYQQQDALVGVVSEAGAKAAKERLFAAEGRLPVVPGAYEVEATLTNNLTHEATRASAKITVTDVHPETVGMSDLIAFTGAPVADMEGQLPFSTAKLRFTPRGPQTVQIHVGDRLPLIYQIWFPREDLKGADAAKPKTVHVHYLVGSISSGQGLESLEEDEDVEVKNLDAAGNLLTGRTLNTSKLFQGTYRLVAKITEAGTPRSAFATMTVKVLPAEVTTGMWTAYGAESRHPAWQEDVQRGVAAQALGNNAEAAECYRRALKVQPDDADILARLSAVTKKETARAAVAK